MDSSATYQAEARRRACTFDGTNHLIASAVLLPVSYMLFGEWGTAAAGVIIFFSYLFTPAGGDLLSILLFRRRRPLPAASGVVVVSGGGMDAAAIAALPAAFAFKRDVLAGEGWAQCAICLGLVREGETVRRLPACGHLFHAGCVDEWLRAHATCPLCRAAVRAAARPPI
ncbi:hypothetical protein ACQ4PT_044052 [Festuca glaucescens]